MLRLQSTASYGTEALRPKLAVTERERAVYQEALDADTA